MSQLNAHTNLARQVTPPLDPRIQNLTGARRGKLYVQGLAHSRKLPGRDRVTYWRVKCDCGALMEMQAREFMNHTACRRCEHIEEFLAHFKPGPGQDFTLVGFSHYQLYSSGKSGTYVWDFLCGDCNKPFKAPSNKLAKVKCCPDCAILRVGRRARGVPREKKNVPTPEIIRLVKEAYNYTGADSRKASEAPTLRKIAAQIGWKVSALRDLAITLGLSRPESRPLRLWVPKETAIVSELRQTSYGYIKTVLGKQGFTRSRNEIRDKITELNHLDHSPLYTPEEIAPLLGFDGPQTVVHLIKQGKLLSTKTSKNGEPLVARKKLRLFLLERTDDYTLADVDRVFFTMLVLKNSFLMDPGRRTEKATRKSSPKHTANRTDNIQGND
jgi:hypothetical protein